MIQVLPSNIANLIAAGEVVSRPASVVKELMENSIDAGAKNVSVTILDAGRTMIQIIDDGCGMKEGDAALCFERHATSKIATAEDLEKIMTYGFRGEALASIAAVAQVTLKTRREEDEVGTEVVMAASQLVSQKSVAAPRGCNIAVSNLFYNVPARRKFLKSDAAEMRHIEQEFIRVALINCGISFSLKHNGKDIYNVRATTSLKRRILELCGRDMEKELVEFGADTSIIKISGFIGNPADARKTAGNQYFFVNGRYFRSPYLNKAVCKPYENLVKDGYTPSYFIFLECPPEEVDVNIHPQKSEVKFTDEYMIFDILTACVRESLGKNAFAPSIDFEAAGDIEFPVAGLEQTVGGGFGTAGSFAGGSSSGGGFSSWRPAPHQDFSPLFEQIKSEEGSDGGSFTTPSASYGRGLLSDENAIGGVMVLHRKFILTPVAGGLAVIHIRKAREAILYHKYFSLLTQEKCISQCSLYPQQVTLSHDIYSVILENIFNLTKLGFDLRDFGDDTVIVYAVPDGFPADEKSLKDVFDSLASSLDIWHDEKLLKGYAATLAHQAAAGFSCDLNQVQAYAMANEVLMLRATVGTDMVTNCICTITNEDLEKKL